MDGGAGAGPHAITAAEDAAEATALNGLSIIFFAYQYQHVVTLCCHTPVPKKSAKVFNADGMPFFAVGA